MIIIIILLVWLVGGGTNVWQLRTQEWCSCSLQSLLEVIEQWLHPRVMTPTNWRFIYFDNFISMDWLSTVANTTGNALSDWLTISSTLTNSWLPEIVVYFWLFLTQSWYRSRSGWLLWSRHYVFIIAFHLAVIFTVAAILELSGKSQFSSLWAASDLRCERKDRGASTEMNLNDSSILYNQCSYCCCN